jgi:hypothetical protein
MAHIVIWILSSFCLIDSFENYFFFLHTLKIDVLEYHKQTYLALTAVDAIWWWKAVRFSEAVDFSIVKWD